MNSKGHSIRESGLRWDIDADEETSETSARESPDTDCLSSRTGVILGSALRKQRDQNSWSWTEAEPDRASARKIQISQPRKPPCPPEQRYDGTTEISREDAG
jgi:hypothetical protein